MPTIQDKEFGEIVVRTHQNATRISIKMAPDGRLRVSVPPRTPTLAVKALFKTSRGKIREMVQSHQSTYSYTTDMAIGKSHTLVITSGESTKVSASGTKIIAQIAESDDIDQPNIQNDIRARVAKALRKEASSYLPRRLKYLAQKHGFDYESVKLTHASSRWGSCSSRGTISLNITLMQLPFELLDYVLIHELAHTKQMNHSAEFWGIVAQVDPSFKAHREALKNHTPHI